MTGLIGYPLVQSVSPQIHALFGDPGYRLIPLREQDLETFFRSRDFQSVNITIPYKETVIQYCDELTEKAKKCQSINTILKQPDGKLIGDNTDYNGFCALLDALFPQLPETEWLILGSGGTSKMIQAVMREKGLENKTHVVSRTGDLNYRNVGSHFQTKPVVVVNATPVGMFPNISEVPLSLQEFPYCRGVIDVIYNPLKTALMMEAKERNIPYMGGLKMLVAQAAAAIAFCEGTAIAPYSLIKTEKEIKKEMSNIILIGMPGSGKTTIGALLAQKTGKRFMDLDMVYQERWNCTPENTILTEGEPVFRRREEELLLSLQRETGTVIATGGGAVLSLKGMRLLRQNGVVVWIKRTVESLETQGRPLSNRLTQLASERMPLYEKFANYSVENSEDLEKATHEIMEKYDENMDY